MQEEKERQITAGCESPDKWIAITQPELAIRDDEGEANREQDGEYANDLERAR